MGEIDGYFIDKVIFKNKKVNIYNILNYQNLN